MLQEEPSLHASSLVLNYPNKSDQKKAIYSHKAISLTSPTAYTLLAKR